MREDGKRSFLGIVMGGCGRYVFFYVFNSFFLEGEGIGGMRRDGGRGWRVWFFSFFGGLEME